VSFKKEYIPVLYWKAGGVPVTGVSVQLKMWAWQKQQFYMGQNAWHDIPLIMIYYNNNNNNITSYLLPLSQFLNAVVQGELYSIVNKFQKFFRTTFLLWACQ